MAGKLKPEEIVTLKVLKEKGQSNVQIAQALGQGKRIYLVSRTRCFERPCGGVGSSASRRCAIPPCIAASLS